MNDWTIKLAPTMGWQLTMVGFELIAIVCFIYLLVKKFKNHAFTHFEGKLYWASIIILLLNLILYTYGSL